VQRPADALDDAALDLPLDIGGVDRGADILRGDKAQDRHLAGLGIDLDIAELAGEAGRLAAGVDRGRAGDRPPVTPALLASSFSDIGLKSPDIARRGLGWPSSQTTPVDINIPDHRGRGARSSSIAFFAAVDDRGAGRER